ncbi:MAG TPA: hypothetical protein K8W01_00355 [Methylorubrum populi]|uniref:Uncharacterized protein n=1 Tax=Methylorubrum populi TaxID=223967 RepID=A0A921JCT9_9HYPH|nr:hypothetical protein [Methylorubrum populi]
MDAVRRVGAYLQVQDGDGCRHLLRVSSVQAVSDTDLMLNETFITAAGRTIRVPQPLDEIVPLISLASHPVASHGRALAESASASAKNDPGRQEPGDAEFVPWPF